MSNSIEQNLVTIAENRQKIYDAGRNAVINELKELQKGTANGEAVAIDVAPINRNNRVMLPVRFLADTFGAEVAWDGETSTATLKNSEVTIVIVIGAPSMTVNNEEIALDSPAIIESSRTYLPLRAIANALGVANSNIAWDGETSTATLTK